MKSFLGIDHFANPEALILLLIIPMYLFWYIRYFRRQRLVIRLSYDPTKLQRPKVNLAFLRILPRALQLIGLTLIILAIARPQTSREIVENQSPGVDIMLLLDTSGSMETTDFIPNRLEAAKENAISFIDGRQNDQIGIVLFAENALSYTPLTLDYDLLRKMIEGINFNILPMQGTAMGQAVAVAINRMRDSENPSRIIVLLTDGANNRGEIDPITASRLAASFNIRIYCIGIGNSSTPAQIAAQGGNTGLDEETLRQMADNTGGKFFRATDPERMKAIFEEISNMEKAEIQEIVFRQVFDHYPGFLQAAIILIAFSFLLMLTFMYNPLEQ
ncbi:MAG: VWA domain-containing protein [Bacteroidia bacterium]|nr:VWA domain-containing protein [Bacteroidia bacterium]